MITYLSERKCPDKLLNRDCCKSSLKHNCHKSSLKHNSCKSLLIILKSIYHDILFFILSTFPYAYIAPILTNKYNVIYKIVILSY